MRSQVNQVVPQHNPSCGWQARVTTAEYGIVHKWIEGPSATLIWLLRKGRRRPAAPSRGMRALEGCAFEHSEAVPSKIVIPVDDTGTTNLAHTNSQTNQECDGHGSEATPGASRCFRLSENIKAVLN